VEEEEEEEGRMPGRIAVVDDEPIFLDLLQEVLSDDGYEAHRFPGGAADYPRVRDLAPDAVILDIRMEGPRTGWDMLERMRRDAVLAATPVTVCSDDLPLLRERAVDLERLDAAILAKPFDLDALLALLDRAVGGRA